MLAKLKRLCLARPYPMGGDDDGGSAPSTTTTISKSEPPEWVKDPSIELMNRAKALSETPYDPYTGQRVAGVDPATTQGLNTIMGRATAGSPLTAAAQGELGKTLGGQYLDPNSNPYLRGMVSQAMGDVGTKVNSQFGGSNYGTTAHQETLTRALGDTANQMYGQNFANERTNMLRAAGMTPQAVEGDYTDARAMLSVGDANRALAQENLNDLYARWQEAQQDPYRKLDILGSGISTAGGGFATTQQQAPNPYRSSSIANMVGGGLLGMGAYKSLFG